MPTVNLVRVRALLEYLLCGHGMYAVNQCSLFNLLWNLLRDTLVKSNLYRMIFCGTLLCRIPSCVINLLLDNLLHITY